MKPISAAYPVGETPQCKEATPMASARKSLHMYIFMMILSTLWMLAGAPLTPEEWAALPDNALHVLLQTPRRMLAILSCWFA